MKREVLVHPNPSLTITLLFDELFKCQVSLGARDAAENGSNLVTYTYQIIIVSHVTKLQENGSLPYPHQVSKVSTE